MNGMAESERVGTVELEQVKTVRSRKKRSRLATQSITLLATSDCFLPVLPDS